jgi:hypothetical protein
MSRFLEAFNYGVETLNISREDFFEVVKNSENYVGEDYSYWLANKILGIADRDGVSFNKIMSNKTSILNNNFKDTSLKFEVDSLYLKHILDEVVGGTPYLRGLESDSELESVDFGSNLDMDKYNCFFIDNNLPESLASSIKNEKEFSILFKQDFTQAQKGSDLYIDAKHNGFTLNYEFDVILYRLVTIAKAFPRLKGKFNFIVPESLVSEKSDVVDYFLTYFECSGGFFSNNLIFMSFKVREGSEQNPIELKELHLEQGKEVIGKTKLFTNSGTLMIDKLSEDADMGDVFGFLCVDGYDCKIEKLKKTDIEYCIPITEDNLLDAVTFFGVWVAHKKELGYVTGFNRFLSGLAEYNKLVYSCMVLAIFHEDSHVNFAEHLEVTLDSKKELLPFFVKEFKVNCQAFRGVIKEQDEYASDVFSELKDEANHEKFNKYYDNALSNVCNDIYDLSEKFL